jgi:hypothetical protein
MKIRSGRALARTAVEVLRRPRTGPPTPPPMVDDPLEALHLARDGVSVAFELPLRIARDTKGFSFAPDGWHPWTAELLDQARRTQVGYSGSLLQRYYDRFQPSDALAALAGLELTSPCGLSELPRELFWLTPWSASTPDEMRRSVHDWVRRGARAHGLEDYRLSRDGTPYQGPVSQALGEIEVRRLRTAHRILAVEGYDRRQGDSLVYLVRRGRELRAVKFGSGYHRTAAIAALGEAVIPAQLRPPYAVDVRDVDDWPQVRRGMWSREAALAYVDHLFEFDARAWAAAAGLA